MANFKTQARRLVTTENSSQHMELHKDSSLEREYGSAGLILGLHQSNKRRHYKVTLSLIGWAQT